MATVLCLSPVKCLQHPPKLLNRKGTTKYAQTYTGLDLAQKLAHKDFGGLQGRRKKRNAAMQYNLLNTLL
jgi:hypothetical protein